MNAALREGTGQDLGTVPKRGSYPGYHDVHRRIGALRARGASAQVSGPGAWVPSQNGTTGQSDPMPHYFSGTDCRASGEAVCPGLMEGEANWMVEAWLSLNGQNLKYWLKPAGEPASTSTSLSLVFDSTHFPPGTSLEVRFKAKDSHGNFYEASGTTIVENQARFYSYPITAQQPGGYGAGAAYARVSPNNYDRTLRQDAWTYSVLAQHLESASVWYINTHSTPFSHTTSSILDEVFDWPSSGTPNYLDWRGTANGTGIPPFNSTGKPPVHLAVLHECNTGEADVFRPILRPFANAYSPIPYANQASIGFVHKPFVDEAERFADRSFEELSEGRTIAYARFEFILRNTDFVTYDEPKVNVAQYLYGQVVLGNPPRTVLPDAEWLPIAGDAYARIRSIYRFGDHGWTGPEDWWR